MLSVSNPHPVDQETRPAGATPPALSYNCRLAGPIPLPCTLTLCVDLIHSVCPRPTSCCDEPSLGHGGQHSSFPNNRALKWPGSLDKDWSCDLDLFPRRHGYLKCKGQFSHL